MYNYKKILKDKKIIKEYEKIDNVNNYYMSHGLKHIKSVVKTCEKLSKALFLSKDDTNNLLISASLHDIGASNGRDNHANKSAEFSREYLKDKVDNVNIEVIYKIIDRHSWESPKENLLEVLLCFADKMDFTKDRLEDDYQVKYNFKSVLENLLSIDFEITENNLIVRFTTNGDLTLERLCEEKEKYDKGIEMNTSTLANWLNKKYKIYFDNKLIFNS